MNKQITRARAASSAVGRPLARLNEFFVWWGDHRGWPASELARVPADAALRPRRQDR